MNGLSVLDMVRERLIADGYDGLYNPVGDCACTHDDLAPCGDMTSDCVAGWKAPCHCGEHDWHISDAKGGERVDP